MGLRVRQILGRLKENMKLFDLIVAWLTIGLITCVLIAISIIFLGCGIDAPVSPTINVAPSSVIDNLPDIGCICPNLDLVKFVLVPKL